MSTARTGIELGPDSPIPDKLYFKIGEVSQLVGVRAHVLRYWEKEISSIRPSKSASNQRRYRRKDVEIFREIRRLLYEERYTLAGARKRLLNGGKDPAPESAPEADYSTTGCEGETSAGAETPDREPAPARAPQLDLGFARAADGERLARLKAGLRELIRMAEE